MICHHILREDSIGIGCIICGERFEQPTFERELPKPNLKQTRSQRKRNKKKKR